MKRPTNSLLDKQITPPKKPLALLRRPRAQVLLALGCVAAVTSVAVAQQINPVWVQHHNGLVNVDPAHQIPILVKQGATGDEAYASANSGQIKIEAFVGFLRYDADHYLIGVRENGIDEVNETDPQKQALAAQYPDRSVIWIDARTGRPLGVAASFPRQPVVNVAQGGNSDFFWKWGLADGEHGQRPIYTSFRYKILRWAPAGTVPDPNFPNGRPTWSTTPTAAWVEPVPDEPNPTVPPWNKWVEAIHSSPAPTGPEDTSHLATYIGSSSGDGSASWRLKAFRVKGSGNDTEIWAGGATWRQSIHSQQFVTEDGGLTFYPIARLNDRGDGFGAKRFYTLGGQPSTIRTEPDGRQWCIQGHFPGTGWPTRPSRHTKNPAAPDNAGTGEGGLNANDTGALHKERPNFFDFDNREVGTLPAFSWEAAGLQGWCLNHAVNGVDHYDGNWVMTADTKDGVDYIVSYAIPSWNQQFGTVGQANAIFKPGWLGLHTLDGKLAPGANNAWKLPCYETDEPIVDPNGNGGTGHDYGYDADVNIYPDPNTPGKALVLAAFGEYGFGAFEVSNIPATGTVAKPADVASVENHPVVLESLFSGTGSPVLYEWQKAPLDGETYANVPGGKGNLAFRGQLGQAISLNIPIAQTSDAGKYRVRVGNASGWITSAVAQVTVAVDSQAPRLVAASSLNGGTVDIAFDELLDPGNPADPENPDSSAQDPLNYEITAGGGTVVPLAATLRPDGKSVQLALSPPIASSFSVKVSNVKDRSRRNAMPGAGQTIAGSVQGWATVDINIVDPVGTNFSALSGIVEVESGGVDIWGSADQFNFVYQEVTGDFDLKTQIAANQRPSNRNGVMARESLDAGSPFVFMTWTPNENYGAHARASAGATPTWFNPENTWVCAPDVPPNIWLRLKRQGAIFTAYRSANGQSWQVFGATTNENLPASLFVGLASNRGGGSGFARTTYANFGFLKSLAITVQGFDTILSWSGAGVLETATDLNGPWTSAGVSQDNPQAITPTGPRRFYRLR